MRRYRKAKIVATLGPSSCSSEIVNSLFESGVDVFRLNFSHGSHEFYTDLVRIIRDLEIVFQRPIGILFDLQGPKIRLGKLESGKAELKTGEKFLLDMEPELGTNLRATLSHREIFQVLRPGHKILVNDGRILLRVTKCQETSAETIIERGGEISNHKGVNVPEVVLPLSALTEKDKQDRT